MMKLRGRLAVRPPTRLVAEETLRQIAATAMKASVKMSNLLITGATGGIGKPLCRHLSAQHDVMPLSRHEVDDSPLQPCDLTQQPPAFKSDGVSEPPQVDWIIHLATTYDVADDLAMLDHLLDFAKRHRVKHFLYVSSWVVHFPDRPLSASYIRMKRACEERVMASGIEGVRILRPSVVLGAGLSWTKILQRLAKLQPLIPPGFTRSFVSVHELIQTIDSILVGQTDTRIITSLGQRASLSRKAKEYQSPSSIAFWRIALPTTAVFLVTLLGYLVTAGQGPAAAGICLAVLALWLARALLPAVLASISDYFAGFYVRRFEPQSEADIIALCHASNDNIQIRGYDNARIYFGSPNSPDHTTVSLRHFDKVLDVDKSAHLVRVQSGAHFGQLLPILESSGLWLENYPNYHFISVGACIATAVHGSNLDHPFLADLVESIRYYDRRRDQILEVRREDAEFSDLIFNQERFGKMVVLAVEIRTCDRQYYRLTSQNRAVDELRLDDIEQFVGGHAQHCEIRINTPYSRDAQLQAYEQISLQNGNGAVGPTNVSTGSDQVLSIKADSIGRKWNLLQRNAFFSFLTSSVSRFFINYEWFFEPQEFARFWRQISSDRSRYRLYKLLVRYNRDGTDLDTPFHGTISIDVSIHNTRAMKELSAELFQEYRPLEHHGKYSVERYIHEQH